MFPAALSGALLGASLVIAIGAQTNRLYPASGLLRQHVFILSLICALPDARCLSAPGWRGLGTLMARSRRLLAAADAGGLLAFLFWYASVAFRRAFHPEAMQVKSNGAVSLKQSSGNLSGPDLPQPACLILDTVLLIGSLSARLEGPARAAYGAGAATASCIWFSRLVTVRGCCSRYLPNRLRGVCSDCIIGACSLALIGLSLSARLFFHG
ncbi:LysE family transporter [Brucella abortus]|nr:LysE family transporter [Brucella abortus]